MSDEWVAFHVFYASDANPIVVEAVRPLVAELRAEGRISGWFFIKYWLEGPHLRVRFKPREASLREEVAERARRALEDFLRRRPALYDTDSEGLDELYRQMFVAEYGEERWQAEYGAAGAIPLRPNNTVEQRPYEQELGRYGGPVGMDIAEWHFEHSSDVVAELLAFSNTHVRPVLLGLATQLSLMSAYSFLRDDAAVLRFFRRYRAFWESSYERPSDEHLASFDKSFARTRDSLLARVDRIRAVTAPGGEATRSRIERRWLDHCAELHQKVTGAAARGELEFSRRGSAAAPVDAPEDLAAVLLSSYIHMTNNRLGAAILDEVYLSYLVERALAERVPAEAA
ncbi:thiopeptide-type bacteriocin biosynthesis protein [Thermobifida halotolerans]|uniref:Thiopeptide-type bacteriocin biosynthesis protein n=1 Tax=Thermobifida halotolerans TaxID=483545 RepID=A0AA97LYJ8_9ACTN|nr:thiopeptide-type bacteriocin biosynthesis protein [Thermobifida halotolerans]UOE20617.1 thiopeptide-type bacteriocin biosynthesis protein [Thermobifida halotolerans]